MIFSDESRFSVSHAGGRVCIEAEMKDMLSAASENGIDLEGGVLWYGEVSWATSRQTFWLFRVISMLNAILTSFHSCRILDLA